ncbi:MAG: c-type cytochrome biogenesis protein CcmI [Legionellales bacterium]|nr:c-type cytochrome biogenesis protein CcmI [Legionellales bacterium]
MILFWSIASSFLLISIIVIIRTLFRNNDAKYSNKATHDQKLREIYIDIENKLISESEAKDAIIELKKLIQKDSENIDFTNSKLRNLKIRSKKIISILIFILVPVFVLTIYSYIGSSNSIKLLATNTSSQELSNDNLVSVEEMLKGVERRLIDDPDNANDWLMLANSYVVLKRFTDAVRAYENLYRLNGDDPSLLFRYADVLAMANSGIFKGKPTELVKKGLQLDPENTMGLWLAGLAEYEEGRINKAIDYWQRVLPKLEKGSDEEKNIKKYIEFAAKENNISLDNSAVEKTNLSEYSIKLNIELSSEFSAVDINNTVFIYAKPVNSNIKMPIVVLRKKVSDLPLELSLDDSMSMLPNNKLSGYESVIVLARISKTGNAKSEKGDLIGVSNPISTRSKETIKIIINSIVE